MKLRTKIVLLALLPAIIVSLCQYTSSMSQLEKGTTKEAYKGMQATAVMANSLLDSFGNGEYQVKGDALYKGDVNLSESEDLLDYLKEKAGYDATLFFGDTRYLTTLMDENGNRQVNTKASGTVVDEVLQKGNEYMMTI